MSSNIKKVKLLAGSFLMSAFMLGLGQDAYGMGRRNGNDRFHYRPNRNTAPAINLAPVANAINLVVPDDILALTNEERLTRLGRSLARIVRNGGVADRLRNYAAVGDDQLAREFSRILESTRNIWSIRYFTQELVRGFLQHTAVHFVPANGILRGRNHAPTSIFGVTFSENNILTILRSLDYRSIRLTHVSASGEWIDGSGAIIRHNGLVDINILRSERAVQQIPAYFIPQNSNNVSRQTDDFTSVTIRFVRIPDPNDNTRYTWTPASIYPQF